jgi:hypothetical protein
LIGHTLLLILNVRVALKHVIERQPPR